MSPAIAAAERLNLPDPLLRFGVARRVARAARRLSAAPADDRAFADAMAGLPVAVHADAANRQHYELPPGFFALALGPHRKYSSCLYETPDASLADAELSALRETCAHAALADGQSVLELGCGWGALSLFMAEAYPASRILAVSNSAAQRRHIEAETARRGLRNLAVVTADMNDFAPSGAGGFDRIVSVEMFEHMSNWRALLGRARSWLAPEGRMFLHVFAHRTHAYRFEHEGRPDWIARYFFTGGIMPSHGLVRHFGESFAVEREWRWSGRHYERTALDWLRNFDARRDEIAPIFAAAYGAEAPVWMRRWRLFFLAVAGLFGHADGAEWGVSHYRLRPAA